MACAPGTPIAVIESEPWVYSGGPQPYGDSYTLAIFSGADLSQRFARAGDEMIRTHGATLLDSFAGQPQPPRLGERIVMSVRAVFGV